MSSLILRSADGGNTKNLRVSVIAVLAIALILPIALTYSGDIAAWARVYPDAWIVPVADVLTTVIKWLTQDASFGLFTFKELTRSASTVIEVPVFFLQGLLVDGFDIDLGGSQTLHVPQVSWIGIVIGAAVLAASLRDRRLVLLATVSLLYIASVGLWQSTMMTLSSVIVAVGLGVGIGILLGIASYRWSLADRILTPLFDFMQTMPVFAYLVPALMLFGYRPAAAIVVTLIYAMPPIARITTNALRQVDGEVIEYGFMAGCTRRQLLWKVMMPAIRPRLMIGVNQVIMLSLNMVIIASLIGAGGLGYNVWQALKALRIGQGAEAGLAITLLAILLDRFSQSYASQRPSFRQADVRFSLRFRLVALAAAAVIGCTVLGFWVDAIAQYPPSYAVTTGRFWDHIVDWININLYVYISAVRDFLFIYVLRPMKSFMLAIPWLGAVCFTAAIGFLVGGVRLACLVGLLVVFLAAVGLWEKAMISLYLVGVSVAFVSVIGIPIGVISATSDWIHRVVQVVIDTLQTLPSFVYLIPAVMLFGVGDFAALIAIVLYAVTPVIRFTDSGIRQIPEGLMEAARMMGCSPTQMVRRVYIPLALPDILLGINQTLMLALSMLVITALVGTRDLGQETLIALSQVNPGQGLTAGICVAFIAIVSDRLVRAWATGYRQKFGMKTND